MAITWYALLLRPAKIRSPSDGMVARCFGPVRHPLKMIFCFGKRAVAGVDGEGVAKVEPAIAIHIEGWHPACVARAQVRPGIPASLAGVVSAPPGSTLTRYRYAPKRTSAIRVGLKLWV